jgi:hypothetical protein
MNDIDSELLYIRAQLVVLPDGVLESSIGGCILIEIRNGKFVSITRIESLELYKQTKKNGRISFRGRYSYAWIY